MATKLENLDLERAHFDNFKEYLPNYHKMCQDTIEMLAELGMLQVSTGLEQAIAKSGKHVVISQDEADLQCKKTQKKSEVKMSSVRTYGYGKSYGAPVTNLHNKTCALRVQVYERKQNKFYYFVIPWKAYCWIPKTSNIEIPFNLDGTPRHIGNRSRVVNWWDYEVASFKEMSLLQLE
jgi:hypothetical protein